MSMEKNADRIFSYTDGDGDSVEFIATADYRLTLTANPAGQQPAYVYMDARAVDGLIDALQYWRGLRQQEVVTPTEEPVATCIMCPHSSLAHGPGLGCRMCPCAIGSTQAQRPEQAAPAEHWCGNGHDHVRHPHTAHRELLECLGVRGDIYGPDAEPEQSTVTRPTEKDSVSDRIEALSLAVQLHSRSPFEHDSGDHALDTAAEFVHWLLTGGRSFRPDIVPKTACLSCLHEHGDDGGCHFMTGTVGACACPIDPPNTDLPNPSCLICRHAPHGATHCGEGGRGIHRCKCTGVATA
jgi:hypothetical protein